ncbi:hypothetical protein MMC13_008074 [Lambiella insularis]|nr:hypothetical protein [Lambiella insularis]
MTSDIPPGFVDLYTAATRVNTNLNVMGVITDYLPTAPTKGTDWMSTFSIADPTSGYDSGQRVKFFRPKETELPRIQGTGDVIVLWNVKLKEWSGENFLISNISTNWAIFAQAAIPERLPSTQLNLDCFKEAKSPEPTLVEKRYAVTLCNLRDRSTYSTPVPYAPRTDSLKPGGIGGAGGTSGTLIGGRNKFSLIKDVVVDTFYDLTAQVVKIYPAQGCVELYITDYTSNNLLYNYEWGREGENGLGRDGDEYGYAPRATKKQWRGPYGHFTMTVSLWEPHSHWTRAHVKEDDFVQLRNVRIKYSQNAKLEGVLHSDRRWPSKVDVGVLSKEDADDRVKDVLRRKRDYLNKFKKQSEEFVNEVRGQKRKQEDSVKPLSKTQLKKRRKLERETKGQEKKQSASGPTNENGTNPHSTLMATKTPLNKNSTTSPLQLFRGHARADISPPVVCAHSSIPPRSLSSILCLEKTHAHTTANGTSCTLPFQNICSRATVRVVDFFPHDLADFAVRHRTSEFDALSDDGDHDDSSDGTSDVNSSIQSATPSDEEPERSQGREKKWEWRFCLLLEDANPSMEKARDRIKVYVADQDAEFLLKMDAENLRKSSNVLSQLREKLFILWGDLEEHKTRAGALQERDPNRDTRAISDGTGTEGKVAGSKPRTIPFQCCLKEYGVKEQGKWKRRFRMFGTTIQ